MYFVDAPHAAAADEVEDGVTFGDDLATVKLYSGDGGLGLCVLVFGFDANFWNLCTTLGADVDPVLIDVEASGAFHVCHWRFSLSKEIYSPVTCGIGVLPGRRATFNDPIVLGRGLQVGAFVQNCTLGRRGDGGGYWGIKKNKKGISSCHNCIYEL